MQSIDNIPRTYIKPSPIHGLGLFATDYISSESLLCHLDGQQVPWLIYEQWVKPADAPFIEWNALTPEVLLVRLFRTKYSYINHSREPNCRVTRTAEGLAVLSCRPINIDEELTLDYRAEPLPPSYRVGHGSTYL